MIAPLVEVPPLEPERRRFSRREVLQIAATSAAGVLTVGAAAALYDRQPAKAAAVLAKIRDHRVALPRGANQMAIVRGADAAANVRKAVEALGGIGAFVKSGEKVLIKPNVGWNRLAEQAANTNPEVVAEVVRMVKAAGASTVWVADVPVNTADRCFERSGIKKAAGEAGATLVLPDAIHFREVEVGGKLLRSAQVLYPFVEADKIINLPIVKQHSLSGATLSMKNWYGALGGHRVRLHQDIHKSIVDLAAMVKPTLTILDATRILMGNGPSGGSLDDVKRMDLIAASADEVALDAWGITMLGVAREEAGFLDEAERAGLGTCDYKSLKLVEVSG
ncbi:MAG: DUF362 domain-containing protein [Deltaproteobacteria bacterium]|nr:DUF362 domain-containing protein [Deltaproteobacteria bacterium]